ncbi:MAG TPA: translocation/assembly module TamB domain-containing protein [Candidatus Elarobacter sp.]
MLGLRASRRTVVIAGIVVALIVLVLARHVLTRWVIEAVVSTATGYEVRFGDQHIGTTTAGFFDVHVIKNGDPIFDAARVDVQYALRDIFPGGEHRFGFAAISAQKPILTITRHADGSLTFNRPGGTSAAPPPATKRAAAPLFFTARIRNGVIRLVDAAPLQPDLAYQTIVNLTVDASVKSDARTTASATGVLVGRRAAGGPVERFPLSARSLIDVTRGFALTRVRARELPLRGVLGFIVHSRAVRFDDGVIDGVSASYYAVGKPGTDFTYRSGGGFVLRGGRITLPSLSRPVRDLDGTFVLTDGALSTNAITASVAGVPMHGKGVIFDLLGTPRFRMGLTGDGDLAALRALFGFTAKLPVRGGIHLETLLAAQLAKPLIRTWFDAGRLWYGAFPIDAPQGIADYYNSSLLLGGVTAHYGAVALRMGGSADFTADGTTMGFALAAHGAGSSLPYTNAIAPDATIDGVALFDEPLKQGFNVRGTLAAVGNTSGAGTFSVNQYGVGEFGPFSFGRVDGESLAGAFELARPISASAGWLHLRNFRLADVRAVAALPGAVVPGLPPISGTVDGDLAAGGTPSTFALAGTISGRNIRAVGYDIGNGRVTLAGTFADVRMTDLTVDGPLGRFAGEGGYGGGVLALDGNYDGSLEQLRPFLADPSAHGGVHGPVRATVAQRRILVQTTGADFNGGSIRGVAVDRVAGTLAVEGKSLRILAADGSIGGGRAVAADVGGPFLVSAPQVPVSALRGAGLPLQGGDLAMFGVADLRGGPRFDGFLAVDNGVAAGYPVTGSADLAYAGTTAQVRNGIAALGTTYGEFDGRIDEVGKVNAFDLTANVPIGDVAQMSHTMRLPVKWLYGSFAAQMHVGGAGAHPVVAGTMQVPEGSYNGLNFGNARADVAITPSAFTAQNGLVSVGSTRAAVAADVSIARRAFAVDMKSSSANLADFNDYFDQADTFAGTGPVAFSVANDGASTRSTGRVDLSGFRYRQFAFGTTDAVWSQRAGTISGALNVGGAKGALRANGTVAPARGNAIDAFRDGRYNVALHAQHVDLATWLPPFGITAPLLGQVDANATIAGRYPRLQLAADGSLANGSVYGYAVKTGIVHARSDGARIAFSNSTLDLGFANFGLDGSVGFTKSDPLALSVHAQAPNIQTAFTSLFPKRPKLDLTGSGQADARISGTFAKPRATVGFEITNGRYRTLAIPRVLGSVAYDGSTLTVNDAEATFAKGNILVTGLLPVRLQPFGLTATAPLSFTLALNGLDLAPFAPFVPGPPTKLGGTVDGRVSIEGTMRSPRVAGTVNLAGGSYVSDWDRAGITRANAQLSFGGTSVALQALHANLGTGTLDGSGRLDLPFPGIHTSGYSIALNAHNARIDNAQFGRGTVNGAMTLASGPQIPILSGDLTLSNASIPFAAIYRAAAGGGGTGASAAPPFDLAFNLMATAGKNVRIQSSNIDIGATGTLDLTGTLAQPRLAGVLSATPGGVFSTYNRAFRVQQAVVRFDPNQGVVPNIDLRAYAHVVNPDPDPTRNAVGSADITVTVSGPADEFAQGQGITFSSSPPYSQEQIVGLLLDASLFGAVNFGQADNGTTLRGAPGESNALLPPGVTPYQTGVINFNQEAFSILNGQLTQRFLAPVERVLINAINLTDFELTVDYGGGLGYSALKQIGKRDVYASFGQTLSYPIRTQLGFTARPDAITSISFNYFQANGYQTLTNALGTLQRVRGIQPLYGRGGFTFVVVRKYP